MKLAGGLTNSMRGGPHFSSCIMLLCDKGNYRPALTSCNNPQCSCINLQ